ncbi:hypothetical protein JYT92_00310 [bacterium AH-315-L15]|nr:hypothetical protein [bacterium AH-315-L15]
MEHWRSCELFGEREKAVLEYTKNMTHSDRQVDDAMIARLRGFFDADGIVELSGLIVFQNLSSKFNSALDVAPQCFL